MESEKFALLSVSDKHGLTDFAKALVETHGYTLLSTGGTAQCLRESGLAVTDVSTHTGFPEMLDGRVKTLHPAIHGGLLCRRDLETHRAQAQQHGIDLIDLIVVNLYPFEQTIANRDCQLEEGIEQIDIGGPALLRSAAKNHASVTVVCDSDDYEPVLAALDEGGETLAALRRMLAIKVYDRTSAYDSAIATYLEEKQSLEGALGMPSRMRLALPLGEHLRYGENPHQKATLYGRFHECFEQLQGKALSYNNLMDITAATYLIGEFEKPTVAILKHTNPCGVASDLNLSTAWEQAFETDQQAPFGGIIIVNQTLDEDLAEVLAQRFCEVIIAPQFTDAARVVLKKKKNLRLMIAKDALRADALQEVRSVIGGVLLQDRDRYPIRPRDFKVVTERHPTEEEWQALCFSWRVVKHVKSNAIVYARGERTLGIGAGQMSRVDASRIAVWKAGQAELPLEQSVVASDAFFPFPDGLIAAGEAGATAAIQPGGSVRDEAVIAAANARNMAMVFTGKRHFRH